MQETPRLSNPRMKRYTVACGLSGTIIVVEAHDAGEAVRKASSRVPPKGGRYVAEEATSAE